jgi:hypothetical protein
MEFNIKIEGSTKSPHSLLHFVPDTLLLEEIAYQTYANGVATSHKKKKGIWPPFPLSTRVCKIENFKQAKDEVGVLSSFKFTEVPFRRHGPQGKLKEHLQWVGFVWSYSHENIFPRELSQQQVLLKSKIPTLDQMVQISKEIDRKKSKLEKIKVSLEKKNPIRIEACEEDS